MGKLALIIILAFSFKLEAKCQDYSIPKLINNEVQTENIIVNVCFGKIPLMVEEEHYDNSDIVNVIRVDPYGENETINFTFIDKSKKGYLIIENSNKIVKLDSYRNFKYNETVNKLSYFKTVYVHTDNKFGVLPINEVEYWINGVKISDVNYRSSIDLYRGTSTVCQILKIEKLVNYYQVKLYVDNGKNQYLHIELNGKDKIQPIFYQADGAGSKNKMIKLSNKTISSILLNISMNSNESVEIQCMLSNKP
ncbi:hypothetical protein L4D09_13140 [Photobacterium makurazakiensis]|uniref:hypothetical protein n=1 Tax=Photobacterium makurazakiensis TaxID=2910234 RepID=UPI003D147F8B